MDEKKQEREEAREQERGEDGGEVEEHGFRGRGRDEDEASEEEGSGGEERGEQDKFRHSDARLKVDIAPLR